MRCYMTDAVRNLNLPKQVFEGLYEAAKAEKPEGRERRFYYLTMTVIAEGKPIDLVVSIFLKTTESGAARKRKGPSLPFCFFVYTSILMSGSSKSAERNAAQRDRRP